MTTTMLCFMTGKVVGQVDYSSATGYYAPTLNHLLFAQSVSTPKKLANTSLMFDGDNYSFGNYASSWTYPSSISTLNFFTERAMSFQRPATTENVTTGLAKFGGPYRGLRFITNLSTQFDALFISGGNSNVGIGTTDPKEAFHIYRNAYGWSGANLPMGSLLTGPFTFYKTGLLNGAIKSSGSDAGFYFARQDAPTSNFDIPNAIGNSYVLSAKENSVNLKTFDDVLNSKDMLRVTTINRTSPGAFGKTGCISSETWLNIGDGQFGPTSGTGNHYNDNSGISGKMAYNDDWRIYGSNGPLGTNNTGENDGRLIFEVGDDGDEEMIFRSKVAWSGQIKNYMTLHGNGVVSIGLTNSASGSEWDNLNNATSPLYKLVVEGTIGARKVRVTTDNWADYVFNKDYKLMPLTEVEKFIKANHHLPEVPTTNEVNKDGNIDLGEMQVLLLKKVEELTLHMIELKKENQELRQLIKNK